MTLNNAIRPRRRPSNHQINGTTPQAPVAAAAIVPDGQAESNMTNEELAAQLKEKVDLTKEFSHQFTLLV